MTRRVPREEHLHDEDFFVLVLPPGGSPEALPAHLSACASCARRFAEWRAAVEDLAAPPQGPSPDFETRVMEEIRSMRAPRSRRPIRRWILRLSAAAALLAAFWLGTRIGGKPAAAPSPVQITAMSETDQEDDELLRDVSRLVASEDDTSWKSVAPLPSLPGGNS